MTPSLLGHHWLRYHPDGNDLSHVERMQYKSVKLFEWHWNNRDACRDLLAVLPSDAYILARDHPMSEQKSDMWADPTGTGTRHANEWAQKVASGNYHMPTERTFFLGINEPDATNGDRSAIDRYTTALLDRLKVHGLRGGAFNFSTGHPRTRDGTGNTQPDYTVFEQSHQAIVRGHHIAVSHIYGSSTMPCVPGHYDRLDSCTWRDVQWVIGECGSDEHVTTGGAHDGYLRTMNPPNYCTWLDALIMGVNDSRIHSYQVFTYDFSHPWDSFDIRPIRGALESYPWQHVSIIPEPPKPQPPNPGPTTTKYVTALAGANLRAEPSQDSAILVAVPYADPVQVYGSVSGNDGYQWDACTYLEYDGYIRSDLLSVQAPQPQPPTPETGTLIWPVQGARITQRFGDRYEYYQSHFDAAGHNGLDFGLALGSPIYATADGIVTMAEDDALGYGLFLRLYHPHVCLGSLYAHCSELLVQEGDRVTQGQQIAKVGSTGNSTGPHLHWELCAQDESGYVNVSYGHSKGRFNPEVAMYLLGMPPVYS